LVTETKLKRLKIDAVNELYEIRRKHARASSEEIERAAAEVLEEIREKK
jgi:hypothetical protein